MKMLKLIQNEIIKTLKRTSTKILLIISVVAILAAMGFANLIMSLNDMATSYMGVEDNWQEETKERINSIQKTLDTEGAHYDRQTVAELNAEKEVLELSIKYNVNYIYRFDNDFWKVKILSEIENAKTGLDVGLSKEENDKIVNEKTKLLENNDYAGYIEWQKQNIKAMYDKKEMTKEEYEDEIYLLDIQKKYEIYKEEEGMFNWKGSVLEDIRTMRDSLRTGIGSTGKLLKLEEIENLKDNIKIAEYRLENNVPAVSSGSNARSLYDLFAPSFSLLAISILMIIIAGSSISTEISKGTIKFLLFTPNKRWKVLLSKIISAVILLLVITLVLSLLTVVIGNICFKDEGTTYVYIQNGEAKALSNLSYTILYYLVSDIDILVYMLFAFMLSTITRNTALSVGVSIACYVGSGTIMQILNQFITADWIKFIPFNNLGLVDKIFVNNISYNQMQQLSSMLNQTTLGFSLTVLAVCAVLMVITTFDSFNKRDIV